MKKHPFPPLSSRCFYLFIYFLKTVRAFRITFECFNLDLRTPWERPSPLHLQNGLAEMKWKLSRYRLAPPCPLMSGEVLLSTKHFWSFVVERRCSILRSNLSRWGLFKKMWMMQQQQQQKMLNETAPYRCLSTLDSFQLKGAIYMNFHFHLHVFIFHSCLGECPNTILLWRPGRDFSSVWRWAELFL